MAITNPLDISNCTAWFDAIDATTVTKTGDNVTAWADKSPEARHITTVTGTPKHGTRFHNNNDVIDFIAGDRMISAAGSNFTQPATIFIVGKFDTNTDNMYMFGSSWVGHLRMRRTSTGKITVSTSNGSISVATDLDLDTLLTITANTTASTIDVDEVEVASGDIGTSGTGDVECFGAATSSTTGVFDGYICQFIRFNKLLSTTEEADMLAWLTAYTADNAVSITVQPPSGMDYIEMATTTVPADSIVFGDTFVVGDQVAFETTANHSLGSTGTVELDEFGVPTITGTSDAGTWTFDYFIKDASGVNSSAYTVSIVVT